MKALGAGDGLGWVCGWDSGWEMRTCELLFPISCTYLCKDDFAGISCLVALMVVKALLVGKCSHRG